MWCGLQIKVLKERYTSGSAGRGTIGVAAGACVAAENKNYE